MPPELMALLAGGGQGGMPPQAPQAGPTSPNYGQAQLPPELMEILMQLLTAVPDKPVGGPSGVMSGAGVPQTARAPTGQEQEMAALMQQMQMGGMPPQGGMF